MGKFSSQLYTLGVTMGEFLSFFDGLRMTKEKSISHTSTGLGVTSGKYLSQLYKLGVTMGEFLSFFDGLRMTKEKLLVTPRLGSV